MTAKVYVTTSSGWEIPAPLVFKTPKYTKKFVKNYAAACRRKGQSTRIVYSK